jgi:hypothetical protein
MIFVFEAHWCIMICVLFVCVNHFVWILLQVVCQPIIDLDESDGCDDVDVVEDSQANAFVDELIVSPPVPEAAKKPTRGRKSFKGIKRNLSKLFAEADAIDRGVPLKAVKLEKE